MHANCPQKFLKICLPNICQMSAKCLPRLESKAKQIQARSIESNQQCKESAKLCPWQPRNHRSCSPVNPRLKPSCFDWRAKQKTNTRQCQKSAQFSSCQPRNQQSCSLANPRLKPSCRPRREVTQKTNTSTIH